MFSLPPSSWHITKSRKNWTKNVFGPSLCLVHLWLHIKKNYHWYLEKCQDWHGDERLGQQDLWQCWKCDPECPETATTLISRTGPVGEVTINNWLPLQWFVVGVELRLQVHRYEPQRCRKRESIRRLLPRPMENSRGPFCLFPFCLWQVLELFDCPCSCHINCNHRNTTTS